MGLFLEWAPMLQPAASITPHLNTPILLLLPLPLLQLLLLLLLLLLQMTVVALVRRTAFSDDAAANFIVEAVVNIECICGSADDALRQCVVRWSQVT